MRVRIRSDRDAYNWLFEQEEAAAAPAGDAVEKAKDIVSTKKVADVVKTAKEIMYENV